MRAFPSLGRSSGRTGLLALLTVALAFTSSAAAADLVDPVTGTRFDSSPTVGDTDFRCLGAGVRKLGDYSVAYCLEEEQADAVQDLVSIVYPGHEGRSLEKILLEDQKFFDALAEMPGEKLVVLHLVGALPKKVLAESFRSSLADSLPKDKLNKLIDTLPADGEPGEAVLLYTEGSRVVIDIAGQAKSLEDEDVAAQLWQVWLGPRTSTPSLKSSIARVAASDPGPVTASMSD